MKGLFEQIRNSVNILLAITVLLLWVTMQRNDPRLKAVRIASACKSCVEFEKEELDSCTPDVSREVRRVGTLLKDEQKISLESAKRSSNIDFRTLKVLASIPKDEKRGLSFLTMIEERASPLVKSMKAANMSDDETVNDLYARQGVAVKLPFLPDSTRAETAIAICGFILLLAYLYLYSSFVTLLSGRTLTGDVIDAFPLLFHQHFVGQIFGYGCVILPLFIWFQTVLIWNLHEDQESIFNAGNGLLLGVWMGVLCSLSISVAKRIWILRLKYFYVAAGGPSSQSAAAAAPPSAILTQQLIPASLDSSLLLPREAFIVNPSSESIGEAIGYMMGGGLLAWFITQAYLFWAQPGDVVSPFALSVPIGIGVYLGLTSSRGIGVFFREGVVRYWGSWAWESLYTLDVKISFREEKEGWRAFTLINDRMVLWSAVMPTKEAAISELTPFSRALNDEWLAARFPQGRANSIESDAGPLPSIAQS